MATEKNKDAIFMSPDAEFGTMEPQPGVHLKNVRMWADGQRVLRGADTKNIVADDADSHVGDAIPYLNAGCDFSDHRMVVVKGCTNMGKTESIAHLAVEYLAAPLMKALREQAEKAGDDDVMAWIGDVPITRGEIRQMMKGFKVEVIRAGECEAFAQALSPGPLNARELAIKAEQPKRQPDYLRHDPTKSHKRRRRK